MISRIGLLISCLALISVHVQCTAIPSASRFSMLNPINELGIYRRNLHTTGLLRRDAGPGADPEPIPVPGSKLSKTIKQQQPPQSKSGIKETFDKVKDKISSKIQPQKHREKQRAKSLAEQRQAMAEQIQKTNARVKKEFEEAKKRDKQSSSKDEAGLSSIQRVSSTLQTTSKHSEHQEEDSKKVNQEMEQRAKQAAREHGGPFATDLNVRLNAERTRIHQQQEEAVWKQQGSLSKEHSISPKEKDTRTSSGSSSGKSDDQGMAFLRGMGFNKPKEVYEQMVRDADKLPEDLARSKALAKDKRTSSDKQLRRREAAARAEPAPMLWGRRLGSEQAQQLTQRPTIMGIVKNIKDKVISKFQPRQNAFRNRQEVELTRHERAEKFRHDTLATVSPNHPLQPHAAVDWSQGRT